MTREEEIFAAALVLSGEARRAYLAQACGNDPVLRENVELLLEAHASSEDFLAGSPSSDIFATVEPQPGDRIGPHVIIRKVGEGGCGLVFLAEQEQPIRRRVALKVIKPGMDSKQVIARFEAERQALAQMEHPDIARVFEAGATPAGRPYFAMEYVDGVPITRFCDETTLPLPARLELFERICLALQHAHQKGIVHRDVKPSNILVALHDGRAAPKIIDFGIAKATQARLTDATLLTGFEQFLGTPAYMSPEQAERRDLDIDTRSDIYSLGVLLYELLTGQPPFDPKSLVRAGVDEIRRIIREVDPPRPSTALSTLGADERTTVAQRRAAAPERLTSVLSGDLDWIVMRCMEKDRARRYGTANELAADIRRHLRSEPVVARPPSAAYRTRKFARRHRVACVTGAAVVLAMVLGTVVSATQAVRANRAEEDARRRQAEAEDILAFMLGNFRGELKKLGKLQLLDEVGAKALTYFSSLDPRDVTDTGLLRHAKALTQIGDIRIDEARFAEAEAAFSAALARAGALTLRHPRDADMLFERAQVEYWIGFAARRRGAVGTAREWFARYRDSANALAVIDRDRGRALGEVAYGEHNLAVLDYESGNLAAAERGFQAEAKSVDALLSAKPADPQLKFRRADIASWLGHVASRDGRNAEAATFFADLGTRIDELAAAEPTVVRWRHRKAESLSFQAEILAITGKPREALAGYQRARQMLDELVFHDPRNQQWRGLSLNYRLHEALLLLLLGDPAAADALIIETRRQFEELLAVEPRALIAQKGIASAWRIAARHRWELRAPDLEEAATRALQASEALRAANPNDDAIRAEHAQACLLAGRAATARNQPAQARARWEEALATLTPRVTESRNHAQLVPAAQALVLLGRAAEAGPLITRLRTSGYQPIDRLVASELGLPLPVSLN